MAQNNIFIVFFISLHLAATIIHGLPDTGDERKPYIVYMGDLTHGYDIDALHHQHHNLLSSVIGDKDLAVKSKIYSYGKSFNGFAARLLPHEAEMLSDEENVVSVFESTRQKLHTTRSWDFLGMTEAATPRNHKMESDIVVGVLDTGIYVESPSFNDKGYGPPPPRWKGKCQKGANFTGCNNKVIGAKYFNLDPAIYVEHPSPADDDGHGTHTSSIAAGVPVKHASLYGVGDGTARGGVSSARIAMYKVCWSSGCTDIDLLAGFDDAIADGVDFISMSIGGGSREYFQDPTAIGAFHAMKKGILTVCSAGNDGPSTYTVQNVAPWILTVAATSIDRKFETPVKLGNNIDSNGVSINVFAPKEKMYPLTSGTLASNVTVPGGGNASACDYGTLSKEKTKGKIVYCLGQNMQDYTIRALGGVGVIIEVDEVIDVAFNLLIPSSVVSPRDGKTIDRYISTTKNPTALISKTRTVSMTAPFVASFSARGPQIISRNILKPDLAAPGLNILAAYSKLAKITTEPGENRFALFNIISGTSMSCPHAAAAAAYVKSFHPDWSPSAIKSALMTTSTDMKIKDADAELGSGSGQLNPLEAVHPGLVYDNNMSSYIGFLCKEGYNSTTIGLLLGGKTKYDCSKFKPAQGTDGLNYPSMHMQLKSPKATISAVFYRTVTQVGNGKSVYKATVKAPKGLSVTVVPDTMTFHGLHEKQSFRVIVKGSSKDKSLLVSALLEWRDGKHTVRSPIVIVRPLY